mgnify:CR=1 FL=1
MKSVFLHFKSSNPCELKINGETLGFIDNINKHSIDILLNTAKLYITYIPVSSEQILIPYTFHVENSDTIKVNNTKKIKDNKKYVE